MKILLPCRGKLPSTWALGFSIKSCSQKPPLNRFVNKLSLIAYGFMLFAIQFGLSHCNDTKSKNPELLDWLTQKGQIVVLGDKSLCELNPPGTRLNNIQRFPQLEKLIASDDVVKLNAELSRQAIKGILVAGQLKRRDQSTTSIKEQLLHYAHIPGLQTIFLMSEAALYKPAPVSKLSQSFRQALGIIARGILGGSKPPRVSSFPKPLMRVQNVEIMVSLRHGENQRLWRSARGNSIAKALITASLAARKRWNEQEYIMGTKLKDALPKLDIDVYQIHDDGTVVDRSFDFINHVFTTDHGMAYEWKGSWRYKTRNMMQDTEDSSPVKIYQQLFKKNGLSSNSFRRRDIRLYRIATSLLSNSPPPSDSKRTKPLPQ